MLRLSLRVEGLARFQRKLRADVLFAPPLREAMQGTVAEAAEIVEARAPRRSGRLAASVTHRLDARPVPTWGRVAVTARRRSKKFRRGYPYGRWLQFSPKSPHQNWFLGALVPAKAELARRLERAKRQIEALWSALG